MKIKEEYDWAKEIVYDLKRDFHNLMYSIDRLKLENENIFKSGLKDDEKEWMVVHNNDAINVLRGEKCDIDMKLGMFQSRYNTLKDLVCPACDGAGEEMSDYHSTWNCSDCDGTGLKSKEVKS